MHTHRYGPLGETAIGDRGARESIAGRALPSALLQQLWGLSQDLLVVAELETGRLVHANEGWAEIFGPPGASRPLLGLIHPSDRPEVAEEIAQLSTAGGAWSGLESRFVGADGVTRWLRWNGHASTSDGLFYAVAADVTSWRRSEGRLELLRRVAVAANESDDLASALQRALEDVCELTGWPAAHAYVPADDQPDLLVSSGAWCGDLDGLDGLREASTQRTYRRGEALPGVVWSTGRAAWLADVSEHPWSQAVGSVFAVPVVSRDRVVAVLEFHTEGPPLAASDEILTVMEHVGLQLGRVHERVEAAAARQAAVDVERRFLSMLTHELRGPVMTVRGFVDLLLSRWDDEDDDRRRELLGHASVSANRMARLVEQFLQLARQHAVGFEPRLERLDVAACVNELLTGFVGTAGDVSVDVEPGLIALADADFVAQILTNLVTNAHRHGVPPIELTVRRRGDEIVIWVRDGGPGVPEEFLPHLFKRFSRADRRAVEGTGLGLSIARDFARAQGGELTYQPLEDGGRFCLRLRAADDGT